MAERVEPADPHAPAVCVLDTGIAQEHVLLKPSLHERAFSVMPGATPADRAGHGTRMTGLALFGDLAAALESQGPVVLGRGLESVRVLHDAPPPPPSPALLPRRLPTRKRQLKSETVDLHRLVGSSRWPLHGSVLGEGGDPLCERGHFVEGHPDQHVLGSVFGLGMAAE